MKSTTSWSLQAPALNTRRTRRLRKKLRVAEFQQMGFEVSFKLHDDLAAAQWWQFWDAFIPEAIEARGLEFGGGAMAGFVCAQGRVSLAEAHREQLAEWFAARPEVASAQVGPLVDVWYGPWDQLGARTPYIDRVAPVHGKTSCSDSNPSNAGPNVCPRCTLLELEALRQMRELNPDTVQMPRELTADNGAKAALIGEFFMAVELTCSACSYHDADPECEVCGGEIRYTQSVPVEWPTIKAIYRAAVRHFHSEPSITEGSDTRPAGERPA